MSWGKLLFWNSYLFFAFSLFFTFVFNFFTFDFFEYARAYRAHKYYAPVEKRLTFYN